MTEGVRSESPIYRAALSPLYVPSEKSFCGWDFEAAAGGTVQCAKFIMVDTGKISLLCR